MFFVTITISLSGNLLSIRSSRGKVVILASFTDLHALSDVCVRISLATDNLDAAIDEEEKIVEDLMDDQDEEGNEVKRNNEEVLDEDNALEDLKDHPRVGNLVGGLKVPLGFRQDEANPQDMNVEEDLIGNQGNYYDGNIDNNNIRNLQRPPDFH